MSIRWTESFKVENQQLTVLPDARLRVDRDVDYTDDCPDRELTELFRWALSLLPINPPIVVLPTATP
jgi:hypothetical protein